MFWNNNRCIFRNIFPVFSALSLPQNYQIHVNKHSHRFHGINYSCHKWSTVAWTAIFSIPVFSVISDTKSAFVIMGNKILPLIANFIYESHKACNEFFILAFMIDEDFSLKLIKWYNVNKRDLPWEPMIHKIYSEIVLQQTKLINLPYYLKFIKEFPKVQNLANAVKTRF